MQAYMKSAMRYHGVPTPLLRKICKEAFVDLQFRTASRWQAEVLGLWREATFREERYAALLLAGDKRALRFQTLSAMKMFEELIVTGAWWDYADDIAPIRVDRRCRDQELCTPQPYSPECVELPGGPQKPRMTDAPVL